MTIDSPHLGLFQVAATEQELNGTQISAGFQQVGGEAMSQDVGMNVFAKTGA